MNNIPFDEWVEIYDEELAKKGLVDMVYRPSNYSRPLAVDGFIKKQSAMRTTEGQIPRVRIDKEEAKIMFPDKKKEAD